MKYDQRVVPYLNTFDKLDKKMETMWTSWEKVLDMDKVTRTFLEAAAMSPNIGNLNAYISHSLLVSRKCAEASQKILDHYPFLGELGMLSVEKSMFMGLMEDSLYLVGGNGTNNPNHEDSNPYHEILTFAQFDKEGYRDLAAGMAMHFVAPEILKAEKAKGRFLDIDAPDKLNLTLDVLAAVDALCTTEYLPTKHKNIKEAFKERADDIIKRRDAEHPLVKALNEGGYERLEEQCLRIDALMNGSLDKKKVESMYGI